MPNPILNQRFSESETVLDGAPMTVNGTITKTFFMLVILSVSALYVWNMFARGFVAETQTYMTVGCIVGLVLALIISFTRTAFLVPFYAAAEGVVLGGASALFESQFPGIVFNAVTGTFLALFSMLFLYKIKAIECTDKFRSVMFISILGIFAVYLVDFIAHFFGYSVPGLYSAGPVGIGISVVIVIVAALSFITDFNFIERGAQNMLPKSYEWYGAFGLMVTLIWLYMEILRLLAKVNSRR